MFKDARDDNLRFRGRESTCLEKVFHVAPPIEVDYQNNVTTKEFFLMKATRSPKLSKNFTLSPKFLLSQQTSMAFYLSSNNQPKSTSNNSPIFTGEDSEKTKISSERKPDL